MKKIISILLIVLLLLTLYLIFAPSPIDAVAWDAPKDKGFTGEFEANEKLAGIQFLSETDCVACEDIAIDATGKYFYGGENNGNILRLDLSTNETKKIANTGGRPLGLHFTSEGNLMIADAITGLVELDIKTGKLSSLVSEFGGAKMKIVDDLEIGPSGKVYFSDASDKYNMTELIEDLMERRPNGALYVYNPSSKKTERLLDDLYFANGVAVSPDESFVLINETGDYSVSKYWLTGAKAGQREVILNNLPGFPDGISRGENGIYWLTLVAPRKKLLDGVMDKPKIRNIVMKLPKSLQPAANIYGCVLGIDGNGKVVYNYQSANPKFEQITSVQQFGNRLYLGSLEDTGVAFIELE